MLTFDYIMPEIAALFIALVTIYAAKGKYIQRKEQTRLIKMYQVVLLVNLVSNIIRYSFGGVLCNWLIGEYIMTLLHHISLQILCCITALYIVTLFPKAYSQFSKYFRIYIAIYTIFELFIITSPLTKLVYYCKDGTVQRGPLCFISFVAGAVMIIGSIVLVLSERVTPHIRNSIYIITTSVVIPVAFEGITSKYITSGLGFVSALILFIFVFHSDRYDMEYGTEDFQMLKRTLHKENRHSDIRLLFFTFDEQYIRDHQNDTYARFIIGQFIQNIREIFINASIYKNNEVYVIMIKGLNDNCICQKFEHIYECNSKTIPNVMSCLLDPKMITSNEYYKFIKPSEKWHVIGNADITEISKKEVIYNQAKDICLKCDLTDSRVVLVAQPIYNRNTKYYETAEILSRLSLPDIEGLVYPNQFIPVIEELKLIHPYNLIVLNKACELINVIKNEGIYFEGVTVNFSPQELVMPEFISEITEILAANNVKPESIHIEITESETVEDMQALETKAKALQLLGFKLYLDDFGTGYSNIVELVKIPFNVVKFDKSIIDEASKNAGSKTVLDGISDTFKKSGYKILYEGVESDESQMLSDDNTVHYIQGYRYSKPINFKDAVELIKSTNPAITAE